LSYRGRRRDYTAAGLAVKQLSGWRGCVDYNGGDARRNPDPAAQPGAGADWLRDRGRCGERAPRRLAVADARRPAGQGRCHRIRCLPSYRPALVPSRRTAPAAVRPLLGNLPGRAGCARHACWPRARACGKLPSLADPGALRRLRADLRH